ncbi:uncharacterized protein LTR77_007874 [Saxophila tyrrhenica]|uniref:Uncharacterized protein n=1 Tax=Saxophila tyrrhenica TaxID=1690608 RepID=A0AAV9P3B7_9PEZI|nr:hypothetical protein LTR77_007874 [Saxophila tyrrhenica]
MASLATTLGLRTPTGLGQPPSYAGAYLIFHFIWAYGLTSSRTLKQILGIDHNVSPREDLSKYGPAAVSSGKITQKQLDMLKRNEGAHANSYENYAVFAAAMIWSHVAGLDTTDVNASALVYTVARLAYVAIYVLVDKPLLSQMRGICWWMGNAGMKAINAAKV